jgi:hypothetical protein
MKLQEGFQGVSVHYGFGQKILRATPLRENKVQQ